jgi:ribonuclease G
MAKEICISSTPHETRLAIVEDDQLTEIYYERENEYTLAGSIYKGKVTRVLPGMQSAFVDLGLERDAFLYVTDFLEEQEDSEEFEGVKQGGGARKERQEGERPEGGRAEGGRSEGGRPGRRGQGRGQDRNQDRDQNRGQERPAAAAPLSIEPEGSALAEAEGEPSAEGQEQDEFQQGTRRWRGRRGRRRGGLRGPREGGAEDNAARSAEGGARERGPASPAASGSISIDAEAAPEAFEPETPRRSEQPRSEGRRERGPVITLPGEALQKYGQQPAAAEAPISASQEEFPVRTPHVTVRPSTLVEHPVEWDGVSMSLPGESLSRYKERPERGSPSASQAPVFRPVFAEPISEEIPQRASVEAPSPEPVFAEPIGELYAVSSEHAPIDTAFPPAHSEEDPGSPARERDIVGNPAPLVLEETEETQEFDPENASASHRVDLSSPSEFRLSSLFGRDAEPAEKQESPTTEGETDETAHIAEQTEPAQHAVETAAQPSHEVHNAPLDTGIPNGAEGQGVVQQQDHETSSETYHDTHSEPTHESAALDHLRAFTPGDGQVEEEVIDEEEYDFAPLPEHVSHDDEHDLSDLVEEETQMAGGSEIGEVIRDAQIDREVTSSEDDFEDSDEEDEEAEGEQPAVVVAGEEETPAPRRGGRNDRQRGRERRGRGRNGRRQSAQTSDLPIISELLKQGQEILVQIAKEPIAKKGARITSHIALPGRFLVFMPTVNHVGVSRKIWSDEERQRLKRILISEKGEAAGGFIVRTAAENASEEELRADLRFLISLWNEIKQRSESAKAPALIYHDLNLIERILRDQVSESFSTIWVDSEAEYERIVRFLNRFQPSLVRRVKLYTKETPLFEQFGIQDEITKALKSKVWLKSGGSIVINQTEALVAIDINTGKYVGKTARLEDTILKTNLDAIPEIVRQIRLRDLGGIIVIDFIDMDERKNRHKVMQALEEELKSDRAPSKVLQFNDFGLVAITRKRVKQSLERTLSVQCGICAGTGMTKSPVTVANEIYIEMRKMQKHFERHDVMLRVHPEVVKTLKGNNARWLNELEEMTGRTIIVKSDPALHPEQFDIH